MRKFKTESKKLLDLMINSIYTNREIFLRELISNASDAADKLYFKSLTDTSIQLSKDDLAITVAFDKDARTVTVSDNGIGMSKDELDKNLGVIAHSDSLEFKTAEEAAANGDISIIGQFGVGFYSAFMVASKVRVVSRAWGADQAFAWESDGVEGYTITEAERSTHGTDVTLTIKPDSDDEDYSSYLSEYGLSDLIRRYSNYVRYPVRMQVTKSRQKPKPDDAGDDYTPEWESYTEVDTINSMVPIWKRRKADVSQEEYNEFYKSQFHDFSDPARTVSVHAEGAISYDVLLFIPSRAPFDLYTRDYQKGLELYSSNVLIMDKCEELVPDHYNFVRGVVDSQDLSLNISRETLQHNSQVRAIGNKIEKKITSELESMRDNDRQAYEAFFDNFGRGLKFGIYSTYGSNASELAPLLLFYSVKQDRMVTLDEYLSDAPDDQAAIYYAAGEMRERMVKLPMVTSVTARGYDVLLCTQDIDEFCFTAMGDYREKPLKNVAGGDLGLETESDKTAAETVEKQNEQLLSAMKEALGDAVVRVAVSARLTDAPAAITTEGPVSLEMERVMAAMPDGIDPSMKSQRVLELNAQHPVFEALASAQNAGDTDKVASYAGILYNQALLMEGLPIDDPVAYAQAVCDLMV